MPVVETQPCHRRMESSGIHEHYGRIVKSTCGQGFYIELSQQQVFHATRRDAA